MRLVLSARIECVESRAQLSIFQKIPNLFVDLAGTFAVQLAIGDVTSVNFGHKECVAAGWDGKLNETIVLQIK